MEESGRMSTADVGIGCETMRCDADGGSIECKVSAKKEQVVTRKVLPNFLAGEEEQPLERQLDLDLNLLLNTVDGVLLEALLRSDRWHHAGVCKDIVV
jgi:hypothetical protein